jgi:hypothetical protein
MRRAEANLRTGDADLEGGLEDAGNDLHFPRNVNRLQTATRVLQTPPNPSPATHFPTL